MSKIDMFNLSRNVVYLKCEYLMTYYSRNVTILEAGTFLARILILDIDTHQMEVSLGGVAYTHTDWALRIGKWTHIAFEVAYYFNSLSSVTLQIILSMNQPTLGMFGSTFF